MKNVLRNVMIGSICGCLLAVSGMAAAQTWHHDTHRTTQRRDWSHHRTTTQRWPAVRRVWNRHDNGRHLGWRIGVGNPHRAQVIHNWRHDNDRRHDRRHDWRHDGRHH